MFSIIKTKLNYLESSQRKEILLMTDRNFMRVEDVARELDVSKSYDYKIVQKLNKELAEKGGQVVGVNSFTLDGNKDEVADAKDVLSKKGVTYKNIWFKSDSEAGKFTSNLYSFPTTYVIDQNGNIVGEPIMGGINSAEQREALNKLIDQALAKSEQ